MKRNYIIPLSVIFVLCVYSNLSALHFIAYGDTRTNPFMHQKLVDAFAKLNPELVIHTGDLWDGYGRIMWKKILTKNGNIAVLLNENKILVSLGNHENKTSVLTFQPAIVRNNSILYSFKQDNTFFVCMGYDPAKNLEWLEKQLASDESKQALWRIIWCHVPVYSSGENGAKGIPEFQALCDRYKVTMVLSGHDHDYERTYPILYGKAGSKDSIINTDEGTVYIVTGGGGAPLYYVKTNWWTVKVQRVNHFLDIDISDTRLILNARNVDGISIDQLTINYTAFRSK
jgi:acid phosphatase type 7